MAVEQCITKLCSKCGTSKHASEFYLIKSTGKLRSHCKQCIWDAHASYVAKNRDAIAEYKSQWRLDKVDSLRESARSRYHKDSDRRKKQVKEWSQNNKDKAAQYKKKWKLDNPQKLREYTFFRSSYRKQATPSWCCRSAMISMYLEARRLTKTTGNEYHVDHIVPLKSELVCGLHWEGNMQILPAFDNLSKLNRRWPDMP